MLDEAKGFLTEAGDMRSQLDGKYHPEVFSVHCNLGQTYLELGDLHEAEISLSEALRISDKMHDPRSKERAVILSFVSQLKQRRGQLDEAHLLLKSAEQIRKKVYGDSHPVYVWTLLRLAELFLWSGAIQDALAYSEIAADKAAEVFGRGHRSFALALSSFGGALVSAFERTGMEEYGQRARSILEEALILQRKCCRQDDLQLAESLNNLGHLLLIMGETEASAPLHEETLKIRKAKQDFARCYESLTGLAQVALFRGCWEESMALSSEALALAERHFGKYHPHATACLVNLAAVLALAMGFRDVLAKEVVSGSVSPTFA